jgi:hypothetical protein
MPTSFVSDRLDRLGSLDDDDDDVVVTDGLASAWPQGFLSGADAEAWDTPIAAANWAYDAQDESARLAAAGGAGVLTQHELGEPVGPANLPEEDVRLSGMTDLHPGVMFREARFDLEINVPDDEALALVSFWSEIMREHAYFYTLWLTDATEAGRRFKAVAADLMQQWGDYISDAVLGRGDIEPVRLAQLVGETGLFKNDVLDVIREGRPYIGAVYESFVLDNLMELQYLVDALAGRVGGPDEVRMWSEHARGHALLDAHMFDPVMVDEIAHALVLADKFLPGGAGQLDTDLVDALSDRLADYSEDGSIMNVIAHAAEYLGSVAPTPQAASEAYLASLFAVRARRAGYGARVSTTAPDLLVDHTIREIAYGLQRIMAIEGQRRPPQYPEGYASTLVGPLNGDLLSRLV